MPDIKKSAIVPHSAADMFQLVNTIEEYSKFIPWCKHSEVHSRTEDEVSATLTFARGSMEKSFSTQNRLQHNKMIEMRLLNGPFKHLEGFWRFEPLSEKTCQVKLDLDFEFSNKLWSLAFGPVFIQVANTLVDAFCKRADEVYGK